MAESNSKKPKVEEQQEQVKEAKKAKEAKEAKEDSDFSVIRLTHGSGKASLDICLYGATIKSWKLMSQEMLYLSPKAIYRKGKGIRGGIPIVFPQFGPGKLPQHGFARTSKWKHDGKTNFNRATGDVSTEFTLRDNEETRKVWNYKFLLTYQVALKATSIATKLIVTNLESQNSFDFTALLHTYFPVEHISKATVLGLEGFKYVDKLDDSKEKEEGDQYVRVKGEVDRIYKDVTSDVFIGDGGNCDIQVKKTGFKDVVVWNPWIEKSKTMDDFDPEDYQRMICVEVGSVLKPVTLPAGQSWEGSQGLSLRILKQ